MTYREPAGRPKRLFFVSLAYEHSADKTTTAHYWVWARESHVAIERVIDKLLEDEEIEHHTDVWSTEVICGEQFAEREALGETLHLEEHDSAEEEIPEGSAEKLEDTDAV